MKDALIIVRKKTGVLMLLAVVFLLCLGMAEQPVESLEVNADIGITETENYVAITFDDGPQYKTTMKLLDGLKERGVVATFFVVGEKIEERREVLERMYEDGHMIGNHTYSHIDLNSVGFEKAIEEIDRTNQLIYEVTGEMPMYIRPPFGNWSNRIAEKVSMIPVLWTVDPCDWNTHDVNRVVKCVVNNTKSGDIILLHDIYDSSVVAALEIVDELKRQGYNFVTVDQLILD